MIEMFIFILVVTSASLLLQDTLKIPLPMTLVSFVLISKLFGFDYVHITDEMFDQIILLLLPILITVDALYLRTSELKKHAFSLFYLAVLAVVLSVLACVALNKWILPDYNLSTAALIALFCMVMATDPVAVTSVFNNFKVPHNLKIMAEGESLFNDATALILYGLALTMLSTPDLDAVVVGTHSLMVIVGAIIIGFMVGIVGLWCMSLTRNASIETMIMLAIACGSYVAAEQFHWSGILATIIGVLTANHVISKRLDQDDNVLESIDAMPNSWHQSMGTWLNVHRRYELAVLDKVNHQTIIQNIGFIALLGGTVLFISMADTFSLDLMAKYWQEIVAVFVAATLVRMAVMSKFAFIAGRVPLSHKVSFHWWMVLSAAGVKGGISILMLHMLPRGFEHRELFEAVIIGQILLSTFIYPIILMGVIKLFSQKFEAECAEEAHHH